MYKCSNGNLDELQDCIYIVTICNILEYDAGMHL